MKPLLEVLFTPADFTALSNRYLSETVCVVFDVLRATSSMVTALANGATAIIPVAEIPEALALRQRDTELLLAGERDGFRIQGELTGGVSFDLGNSPREFTEQRVRGRRIAMTTTNGTRALRACANAKKVLVASFLNIDATIELLKQPDTKQLLVVCSGTFEQAAYEDALAAGALCEAVWPSFKNGEIADSALIARELYQIAHSDLLAALSRSRNGRRLLQRPELRDDVPFCAQRGFYNLTAELGKDAHVRRSIDHGSSTRIR